ncbi:MAG: hypothetical protein QM658_15090 [Gordonia sp. (in: high G+C Gram-positive bacteria)]
MKTTGKWLTFGGLIIAIASVVAGIVMIASGFGKLVDITNDAFSVDMSTKHSFSAGDEISLYWPGSASGAPGSPSCTVTDGLTSLVPRTSSGTTSFTYNGESVTAFATYTFNTSGEYTITCDQVGVIAAPPLSVSGIFRGVGGVLVLVFGAGFGALLLIIGVILWIVGANRAKRLPPMPPTGYPSPVGYPQPGNWS